MILLGLGLASCESEKRYSDYNESDLYEVRGFIESSSPTSDPFDNPTEKNIRFKYFLDRDNPKSGMENDLEMFEAKTGFPLIVLVHKNDENISFYGRVGILENLNSKEKEFLSEHIKNQIELINKTDSK
ncbi:MAG: hypothetical protein ABF246_07235 [Winogradskyella sp.]